MTHALVLVLSAADVLLVIALIRVQYRNRCLIAILRAHHSLHLRLGTWTFRPEAGDPDEPIDVDLSAEYADTRLCTDTMKAIK